MPQSKYPEQIWCTIKHVRGELLVGVCYRSGNETLFSKEINYKLLELIAKIKNKQVILIVDFNYPDIEWSRLQAKSEASQTFVDCMKDSYLTQHVAEATRGENVLDLVITSDPGMTSKMNILGQFGKSDHSLLQWETEVMVASKRAFRPTLDYGKANYPLMKKELRSMN